MSHATHQSKYTRRYRPCHTLAQYAITQIDALELRAQDIVKKMGYPLKHTIPACERLRHVLSNRYLGLDGSYTDKYFTADEFLAKLFAVLELRYEPFAEDIAHIKYALAHYPNPLLKYRLRAEVDDSNLLYGGAMNRYRLNTDENKVVDSMEHRLAKASNA